MAPTMTSRINRVAYDVAFDTVANPVMRNANAPSSVCTTDVSPVYDRNVGVIEL